MLTAQSIKRGGRYNWKGQTERLVYTGYDRTGIWHQFEKAGEHGHVWCEVRSADLHMLEPTPEPAGVPGTTNTPKGCP